MTLNLLLTVILCANIHIISHNSAGDNSRKLQYGVYQHRSSRSPFRYVLVSNIISGEESDPNDAARLVEVLLDSQAFSEANLKKLFKLVSERFPVPQVLDVRVYTHLEDVQTPEEREAFKASEGPDNPSDYKYHRAFYLRDYYSNEWFTYNPNPPSRDRITIVLTGRSPQSPQQ